MKKREAILIVIAVIVTALAYFSSKETEKRVQEFIEQKESKEDKKLKLVLFVFEVALASPQFLSPTLYKKGADLSSMKKLSFGSTSR